MVRRFALTLLVILCSLQAVGKSLFVPTGELEIRRTEKNFDFYRGESLVARLQKNLADMEMIDVRLEPDCIVIDLSKYTDDLNMPKVTLNWYMPQTEFGDNVYELGLDVAANKRRSMTIYFEGRTPEGTHFYYPRDAAVETTRQHLLSLYGIPPVMKEFHCRFDFIVPGVYRIYDVFFERADVFLKPADAANRKAELLFHASYDGSTTADFAKGDAKPVEEQNVKFVPGIKGQAIYMTKDNDSVLGYAIANNVSRRCGAVSMWVNPQWGPREGTEYNPIYYRNFFGMKYSGYRMASGALWFWSLGESLRWDTSDLLDSYKKSPVPFQTNRWYHIVMNWDEDGGVGFIDGEPVFKIPAADGFSPLQVSNGMKQHLVKVKPELTTFYIGSLVLDCYEVKQQAESYLDDVRIYSAPLSLEEIKQLAGSQILFKIKNTVPYMVGDQVQAGNVTLTRMSKEDITLSWCIKDADGTVIARNEKPVVFASDKATLDLALPARAYPAGNYSVHVSGVAKSGAKYDVHTQLQVFNSYNPWSGKEGGELELEHVTTIVPKPGMPEDEYVQCGSTHMATLNGRSYLETDNAMGSRFVLRAKLPDKTGIYLLEWDYPDDKYRSVDVTCHSSWNRGSEYELQSGYATGGEYYNTQTFITQRCLYFTRSDDISVIFMAARNNTPAACAELRIYRVKGGLPGMEYVKPATADGKERVLGVYYEDPAINYDFGVHGGSIATVEKMVCRLASYMKYSGQNMLTYPMVWYQGIIGDDYNPRGHAPQVMEAFLTIFDREGLGFMPSFNWHNIHAFNIKVTHEGVNSGAYHDSPIAIWKDGRINPGLWHGSSPNYNILHPAVQKQLMQFVDELLAQGLKHPSFKGITLHLTRHCTAWFGELDCGYNDYAIEAFEAATGIRVPVDRKDPMRGKLYADWLLANAREQWVDWRCKELSVFYKKLAAYLKSKRSDLVLNLTAFNGSTFMDDENYQHPMHNYESIRNGGLDMKYYEDCDNITFAMGTYPADYRWREQTHMPKIKENWDYLLKIADNREYYLMLESAKQPWIHMHDRYWESAMGSNMAAHWSGKPRFIKSDWFRETAWRVSTINPSGFHAMKHYVMPLRYNDLLGITKGGFLIGTYGMEEYLTPFAKAFRALPAKIFAAVDTRDEFVKARRLVDEGSTWFYVVNTSDRAVKTEVMVDGEGIVDLVSGKTLGGSTVSLDMQPYQLRSFKVKGARQVKVSVKR